MKCPSCGYENSDDARYCGLCQQSFLREPSAPYGSDPLQGLRPEPSQEAQKTVQKILKSQAGGENWFQRHLNWTWMFAQWAVGLITYVLVTVLVTSLLVSSSTLPSEASLFASISVIQIVVLALQMASEFGVGAWVLKRKNRSLGWLLIFLVPLVGWIIFLCLENRSDLVAAPMQKPKTAGSSVQPGLAPTGLGSQYNKYGP
jgi:hypothetical protein